MIWNRNKQTAIEPATNDRYRNGNGHLIALQQVVKTYRSAAGDFTALKDVDLEIDGGEFVAVIGKSTFLSAVKSPAALR